MSSLCPVSMSSETTPSLLWNPPRIFMTQRPRDTDRDIIVTCHVRFAWRHLWPFCLLSVIIATGCLSKSVYNSWPEKCAKLWKQRPFPKVFLQWMNDCCDVIQELYSVMIKYCLIHKLASSCHIVSKLFCFLMTLLTFFSKLNKNIYIKFDVKTNKIKYDTKNGQMFQVMAFTVNKIRIIDIKLSQWFSHLNTA